MPEATTKGGGRRKSTAAPKTADIRVLTLAEIEQATHLREKVVPVPEWGEGVGVRLRQLTKAQHVDVKKLATVRNTIDEDQVTYHAIIASMIEPTLTQDQIGVIASWPSSVVDRIEAAMLELNGMTSEALEALEAAFRAITG
jgi:hypothetical protein